MKRTVDGWLHPDWRIDRVACGTTTRLGGFSVPPWDSLNTALHTGDSPEHVAANRQLLKERIGAAVVQYVEQVHGTRVLHASAHTAGTVPVADALWTAESGLALVIQTADCLPVMIAASNGSCVGAAHAGWRGLAAGVIPALLAAMPVDSAELNVWIGPGISGACYEVDDAVVDAFAREVSPTVLAHAVQARVTRGKWLLDLQRVAVSQLVAAGVPREQVSATDRCTFSDPSLYSFRREGTTGRLASYILRSA